MPELDGQVAIVSGASRERGLGLAIALALARAGANVVVTGRGAQAASPPQAEAASGWRGLADAVGAIEAAGAQALGIEVDVTDSAAVQRMVERVVERFGRIDILVNNATYPRSADRVPLVDLDESLWRQVIDINLTGTMLASKHVARRMIAQGSGGSIVGISSIAAMVAPRAMAAYAASKAAVHALSASLADDLAPHGITCNVVAPGFLDTARVDALRAAGKWEQRLSTIPIKRAGTAAEVAELVRFLCGPHARWITGEVITVAGGEVRRAAR